MIKKTFCPRPFLAAAFALSFLAPVRADISGRPDVSAFIKETSAGKNLDEAILVNLFRQVDMQQKILDAMDHPAESRPWLEYRKNMVTEAHIQGGVGFWKRNQSALDEALARYGVAPEMIVAIIGVETRYGQITGGYRVIDALSTLAFGYPRRADFFRKELKEYLLLCKEENIDPVQPKGSYAGAMGMPQFLPSSYRQYATDMDGDRHRNIWSNPGDAIASVANFLAHAGWRKGEPVAVLAKASGEGMKPVPNATDQPERSIGELRRLGLEPIQALAETERAKPLALETETGTEYWLALHNFGVIKKYNQSRQYVMAAFQLSKEILARKGSS